MFKKKDFDELPPSHPWDHVIELLPGTEPQLNCKIYPLSQDEREKMEAFVDENLCTGQI